VGGGGAGDDAPGADAGQRRPVGATHPLDGVQRVEYRLNVGVKAPAGVPGVRVAPGDHEHLLAVLNQVLDHAAAGCQVQHVVLVDGRRHDEQRYLPDLIGLRPVLDQLQDLGAQHHCSRRDGDVAAHLEL
jgi:hypothetical protein